MKLQVNLTIIESGNIETTETGARIQKIKAFELGYRDEFGEAKGRDQIHDIKVLNKTIDFLPEVLKKEFKGEIKCRLSLYINSSSYIYEGREFSKTELILAKLEVI